MIGATMARRVLLMRWLRGARKTRERRVVSAHGVRRRRAPAWRLAVAMVLFTFWLGGCPLLELPEYAKSGLDLFVEDPSVVHVAPWGSDAAPGTAAQPLLTIQVAVNRVRFSSENAWTVKVAAGEYRPGAGLTSGGRYGLLLDQLEHVGNTQDAQRTLTLSTGWDRLFRTQELSDGRGWTRLIGEGAFEQVAVVRQYADADGTVTDVPVIEPPQTTDSRQSGQARTLAANSYIRGPGINAFFRNWHTVQLVGHLEIVTGEVAE